MRWKRRPKRGRKDLQWRRWWREARGVTTTEAVMLIALGALIVLGGVQLFGGGIGHQYENVTRTISGEEPDEDKGGGRYASSSSSGDDKSSRQGGGGDDDEDDGDQAVHTGEVDRDGVSMGPGARSEETKGSVGGVNPLIILLLIGGVLAVGYFIYADDD